MKINIPITDLGFKELILILKKYPNGVVKVENNKAIWNCDLDLSSITQQVNQSTQQPNVVGKGNIFSSMADEITHAFGG